MKNKAKNKNLIFIPNIRYKEVKNPKTLIPTNWEEIYDEDRVMYEYEEEFDEFGNFLGMKKNVYVIMEEVASWRIMKRKYVENDEEGVVKLKPKKLFEIYSDEEETQNEEIDKEIEKSNLKVGVDNE